MFEYLKKYIGKSKCAKICVYNEFLTVSDEAIIKAEQKTGYSFPKQLKAFYREIGYGALQAPHILPDGYTFCNVNMVHHPSHVAILTSQEGIDEGYIAEMTHQFLQPGDLPFFEIGDSTRFLIMKTHSDNPNAVWGDFGDTKIEDSLERFIWRLYYENPSYYDDIILEDIDEETT